MIQTVTDSQEYRIELPSFSGPFDLLLHLIERNEMDITAISLATVANQYLDQVNKIPGDKLDHLVDFLVIAARLLVIKSRALLPQIPTELNDAEEEEDPAEMLARQLRIYSKFKSVAGFLRSCEEEGYRTYLRVAPPPLLDPSVDMTGISLETLSSALICSMSWTLGARSRSPSASP